MLSSISHTLNHFSVPPSLSPPLWNLISPYFYSLSFFRQLLACRLGTQEHKYEVRGCFCVPYLCFMNVWDSPQTQPSCLLWRLLPSSAFVSLPPSLLYRRRSERWAVSVPISLIFCLPAVFPFLLLSPPPATSLPVFFSFVWFNIYQVSSGFNLSLSFCYFFLIY